jgi:hypothetical protein
VFARAVIAVLAGVFEDLLLGAIAIVWVMREFSGPMNKIM